MGVIPSGLLGVDDLRGDIPRKSIKSYRAKFPRSKLRLENGRCATDIFSIRKTTGCSQDQRFSSEQWIALRWLNSNPLLACMNFSKKKEPTKTSSEPLQQQEIKLYLLNVLSNTLNPRRCSQNHSYLPCFSVLTTALLVLYRSLLFSSLLSSPPPPPLPFLPPPPQNLTPLKCSRL